MMKFIVLKFKYFLLPGVFLILFQLWAYGQETLQCSEADIWYSGNEKRLYAIYSFPYDAPLSTYNVQLSWNIGSQSFAIPGNVEGAGLVEYTGENPTLLRWTPEASAQQELDKGGEPSISGCIITVIVEEESEKNDVDSSPVPVTAVKKWTIGHTLVGAVAPGVGHYMYNRKPLNFAFTAVSYGLAGSGLYMRSKANDSWEAYLNATAPDDIVNLRETSDQELRTGNILLAAGGGIWVINLVRCFITGSSDSNGLSHVDMTDNRLRLVAAPAGAGIGLQYNF
ncbi:MAG: hypothetical protein NXI25_03540 [bacterium]|nr:hypothetical protein [bacterium]